LPKHAGAKSESSTFGEAETALELAAQEDEARSADEPTAEQLVAILSKISAREREAQPPSTPLTAYKAKPISFAATPWDVFKLWARAHWLRLSVAGAALLLILAAADLFHLLSLNTALDREWLGVEAALRQRYAMAPAYVDCITIYSDNERFTLALTERALAAWRTARTEKEVAAAATQMENALTALAKAMSHWEQITPAKDAAQTASSNRFAELQREKDRSRGRTTEAIRRYNQLAEDFNDQVGGVPGAWIARVAGLHPRATLFTSGRH